MSICISRATCINRLYKKRVLLTVNKNLLFPILYATIWVFILFLIPKSILYSGTGILRWVVFAAIFVLLPYLLNKSLQLVSISEGARTALTFLSVFLGIPFGIWLGIQSDKELLNNGRRTFGVVERAWNLERKSRADVWAITAKYVVNNKYYRTSTKENPEKTLFEGDTVTILYSKRTPEMSEIIELVE